MQLFLWSGEPLECGSFHAWAHSEAFNRGGEQIPSTPETGAARSWWRSQLARHVSRLAGGRRSGLHSQMLEVYGIHTRGGEGFFRTAEGRSH